VCAFSSPQTGDIRGVWVHPGYFGTEKGAAIAKMQTTLDDYQKAGINTLIVLVKTTSGYVYYKSAIAQRDTAWNWDFFGAFLEQARQRQMTVHPWFCVFNEGGIPDPVRQHPEWLIRGRKGELVGVANPALPEVRRYEISLMTELLQQYPVDWIHLDYIRYPCEPTENYYSFDPQTRARFKEYSGEDPLAIKATDSGNMLWNEWINWNGGQVEQFMRELRDALKTTGRRIRISAAVFPHPDNAKVLIGQDWAKWAREGLVDMLCPMLYTNNEGFFEEYTKRAVAVSAGHCQMCAGIGIGTSHNQNTPEGMLKQVEIAKRLKADGVIFFSSSSLKPEFLKTLEIARSSVR
jgi:uncharacterized lipoprotein YddW (UPF0748 family)